MLGQRPASLHALHGPRSASIKSLKQAYRYRRPRRSQLSLLSCGVNALPSADRTWRYPPTIIMLGLSGMIFLITLYKLALYGHGSKPLPVMDGGSLYTTVCSCKSRVMGDSCSCSWLR